MTDTTAAMTANKVTNGANGLFNPPTATNVKIQVRGLERVFSATRKPVHALGPVDLDIRDGEFVSVVGPSGCGKSTMLRILAGLQRPSSGEVQLSPSGTGPLTSVVFQDYSIYPWKSVAENVRLGLDLSHVNRRDANERVAMWLDRLGLSEFADAYPSTLSGGMRQRVAIARALAVEPEIILMDEPFAALDAQLRTVLQDDLLDLWENDRRTVVFITHSLEEALVLSDRVVVMGARPGCIVGEYVVPFGRPRDHALRASADFAALEQDIWATLRVEVDRTLARETKS